MIQILSINSAQNHQFYFQKPKNEINENICHIKQETSHREEFVTCHKVFLQLFLVSYLRYQSSKNTKVKTHGEYYSESTQFKGSILRNIPKRLPHKLDLEIEISRIKLSHFSKSRHVFSALPHMRGNEEK